MKLADGSHAVQKQFGAWGHISAKDMADAEELSYRVADAIGGTNAKAVIRIKPDTILMDYAVGSEVGHQWLGGRPFRTAEKLYNSPTGYRIGVMDILNSNDDRHGGNWLVAQGLPVPIDNSSTFGIGGSGNKGPFRKALERQLPLMGAGGKVIQGPRGHPFSQAEIDAMNKALSDPKLVARFRLAGKTDWYNQMFARWQELKVKLEVP